MPHVTANAISMYYEMHGRGEPLVLIGGLGKSVATWREVISALSAEYRVIAFDSRGAGQTDKPTGPYSMELFADDAAALMGALNIESAHVLGHSLGGMIAQHLVLLHPGRVRSLALVSTASSGRHTVRGRREVTDSLLNQSSMTMTEAFEASLSRRVSDSYARTERDRLWARYQEELRLQSPPDARQRQLAAVGSHDTYHRLPLIRAPTLIMAGSDDPIATPENARILAERIPNSELRVFEGLRHALMLEGGEKVMSVVLDFLKRRGGDRQGLEQN